MDNMLYVSMTGMSRVMEAQAGNAQNLANVSTTAFKATLDNAISQKIDGPGIASRFNVQTQDIGPDISPGPLMSTERSLDIAIQGEGWMVVQAPDGGEALTRRGDLQIDANGLMRTGDGNPLMGDGGPIAVPPYSQLTFGGDGTISIVPLGQGPNAQVVLERIMLVRPDNGTLERGTDGLFRTRDGQLPPADADVRILSGHLEGSNVNMAEAMVQMIDLARQFEMQVKMMRLAGDNADVAAQLTTMGG
ncbi:MAG TPA: flagellar basal body rod protein FlgF [Kineobactrum sp.]